MKYIKVSKSALFYVLSAIIFIISVALNRYSFMASINLLTISFLSIFIGTIIAMINKISNNSLQYSLVFMVLTVFFVSQFISSIKNETRCTYRVVIVAIVSSFISLIYWAVSSIQCYRKKIEIKKIISNFGYLILILVGIIVVYAPNFSMLFKGDSYAYYSSLVENVGKWQFNFNNLSSFRLGYHSSYGYAIFMCIGNFLIPTDGIGIRLMTLLIFLVTVCLLNEIIAELFPKMGKIKKFIVLSLFSFNPLTIGIIQEMNPDFAALCFFIWMINSFLKKRRVLLPVSAMLLAFSKENAIFLIAGFMIGVGIYRLISKKYKDGYLFIFDFSEWLIILVPILFYLDMFWLGNSWGNAENVASGIGIRNTFQVNIEYIFIKLKQMYVLNFQWLFLAIVLFVIILSFRKRKVRNKEIISGLALSYLFWLGFQLLYFTYPHYRYTQVNAFYFTLIFALFLDLLDERNKVISYVLGGCVSFLFFVQTFVSIDCISNKIFRKVSTGNGEILSLAYYTDDPEIPNKLILGNLYSEKFRDYVQNNRQYLGFEKCFEKFMKEIDYNGEPIVLSPIYRDNYWGDYKWTFCNMFGTIDVSSIYWNNDKNKLTYEKEYIPIKWITLDDLKKYDETWFVYLPFEQGKPVEKYLGDINNLEFKEVIYGQWKIYAYKLK